MSIYIENPSGNRIGPLDEKLGPQRYRLGNTELLIYYGKPGPYHLTQEGNLHRFPSCGNLCGQWRLENHSKWKKGQRSSSIVNAMGDCKWKRSLPLWGKSKSLSPKRRQTIAGVRGVSQ